MAAEAAAAGASSLPRGSDSDDESADIEFDLLLADEKRKLLKARRKATLAATARDSACAGRTAATDGDDGEFVNLLRRGPRASRCSLEPARGGEDIAEGLVGSSPLGH